MVVPVDAGVSTITLHDGPTLVRQASTWASLIGLVLIAGAAALLARQDWQRVIIAKQPI